MTTVRALGRSLPCAGGGWFRLLPYQLMRSGLRRVNTIERQPSVFYFHPWEIDPGQPRAEGAGRLSRFRHYVGLRETEARLVRLLRDFRWGRMDGVFAATIGAPQLAAA